MVWRSVLFGMARVQRLLQSTCVPVLTLATGNQRTATRRIWKDTNTWSRQGETEQSIKFKKPRYVVYIDTAAQNNVQRQRANLPSSLVTLDKIWGCRRHLLHPGNNKGDDPKDLSLAFALSRLLRCRLEDVTLQKDIFIINRKLVKTQILEEHNTHRAFRAMELQLSFVDDYFNTRYPMVFWNGFCSLFSNLLLSAVTFGVVCWLAVDIRKVYKPPKNDRTHVVNGFNIDMFITWVFMFFMLFKEIWETKDDGATLGCAILVPECVKPAILKKLCASLEKVGPLDTVRHQPDNPNRNNEKPITSSSGHLLPKVITSLSDADGNRSKRYGWACFDLPTCSHVILVWHIATSLCEMKLARSHGVDLSKCSSKPYLIDVDEKAKEKKEVNEKLQEMYITANSLSRYCAYLLVSKPDLIPDSFLVPKMVLEETVTRARDDILKNCDSLQSRYDKLMKEAEMAIQDAADVMEKEDVVRLGAMLGKELIDQESEEECWEILSGVWADLLVRIAPTWNAEAHKQCLESGGEFITYIWALLWHCGIEKSELWPVEDVYGEDSPGRPQDNSVPNGNVQLAQEMQQTCAGSREEREEVGPKEINGWTEMGQINEENSRKHSAKSSLELGQAIGVATSEHYGQATHMLDPNGQGNVVRGMKNFRNTCYFSAVLQSLLALDKLRARMLGSDALTGDLGQELQKLFVMTSGTNGARGVLMPEKLFLHMCSRNSDFRPGVMEDSNNMLASLPDGLNNEEPKMVESLFRGKVVKHVSSKECDHTSDTTEDLDLSLAIPSKKSASIEDCLDLYATGILETWHCTECSAAGNDSLNQEDTAVNDGQPEQSDNKTYGKEESSHPADRKTRNQNNGKLPVLDGNANQMEQRHTKQREEEKIYRAATVKYRISKAATILAIQLKRFNYSHTDKADKLEERVSFQDTLDITEFMDPGY
uniref:Uncharacterized protein n=1 Tax=Avena sativa TaxID=4498 RepID=A0ACD5T6N3_AVESA